ncbi:EAL domain-containing protein [Cloacibacillus sp.]
MPGKYILAVDDSLINRKILSKIISGEYSVIEAENGEMAIEILRRQYSEIAAIILDIVMPVMDGYMVLERVADDERFRNIPIIIATEKNDNESEIKALRLGAWDFVSKPYNGEIIKFRIKNAIERSQLYTLQQLRYLAEFDELTGIYNKNKFYKSTREMLLSNPGADFVLIRFDVDRFQLINSFFGTQEGNRLLKYIAKMLSGYVSDKQPSTYGRIEADVFCLCFPSSYIEDIETSMSKIRDLVASYNLNYDIVPSCGIYYITDRGMPIEIMYDRATLAAKRCKGNYVNFYAVYDGSMSAQIVREQELTNEMSSALATGQFQIYLQPKYHIASNRPVGAEALVRWFHPQKGLISPGDFVPVFERNGFIPKLDYYVWEEACKLFRKWADEGRELYPISVNISRVDLYNPRLAEMIIELTEKYDLPPELLNLELTESAYTDNPVAMSETMAKLQARGFTIMMDDFGSGYSSLNILKDISVDVLKIDMRFLSKTKIPGRGENIIASVVRMAKWLHIPVIAEGVETKEQVDFLRGIGCEYVQGFYFAKPMPVDEYADLIKNNGQLSQPAAASFEFNGNQMWISDHRMEELFADMLQPVAIYEFENDKIEAVRVNTPFFELLGYDDSSITGGTPLDLIDPKYHDSIIDTFRRVAETHKEEECEYLRRTSDGKSKWLRIRLKYISKIGARHIFVGVLTDITIQRELDMVFMRLSGELGKEDK